MSQYREAILFISMKIFKSRVNLSEIAEIVEEVMIAAEAENRD